MKARVAPLLDPAELYIPRIDEDPAYKAAAAEIVKVDSRLAETRQRRERAQARMRGVRPMREAVARAADLVSGGKIPAATPAAEIAACEAEEYDILRPALREMNTRLNALRADLSYEACLKVRQAYDDGMREMLRGIETIAAAAKVIHGVRARLHAAGYSPNDSVLLNHIPPGVLAIGDPHHANVAPAWFFRERLKEFGVI